jgi:hypothetical protein
MAKSEEEYVLKIGLNVLTHLGINLYSNVPAVLSEIVANSWDADATSVYIEFDKDAGSITIHDDGIGMTLQDVNHRFLHVGYQRRKDELITGRGRLPMGRKGIGKLSLFSIAGIVEVYTAKGNSQSAFRMNIDDIKKKIEQNESTGSGATGVAYKPTPLSTNDINFSNGTKIVLTNLKRQQTIKTPEALRRRVARRFSIIDDDFKVYVNGKKIAPADRDYYSKLQFLWTYGKQSEVISACDTLDELPENRDVALKKNDIDLKGWIGTVHNSKQLKDHEHGENLNRLAIFVRGKMAQEDILADLIEHAVYANYLIGELNADFLDTDDDKQDAATSSRQRLVEDDPRYVKLKQFIQSELAYIKPRWLELRNEQDSEKAMAIPVVADWVDSLHKSKRNIAKSWMGRIYKLSSLTVNEKKELLKYSIVAFAHYDATESLARLEKISDDNIQEVLRQFKEFDSIEQVLYGQIVKQRIKIIDALKAKMSANLDEKISVIQDYLFDHLWLLDPDWERADIEESVERGIANIVKQKDADLDKKIKKSRLVIKYRKTANSHLVIELKRPDAEVAVGSMIDQIGQYQNSLYEKFGSDSNINFVILLDKYPEGFSKEMLVKTLDGMNTRIVLYENLLSDAQNIYADFIKNSDAINMLNRVMEGIDQYEMSDDE